MGVSENNERDFLDRAIAPLSARFSEPLQPALADLWERVAPPSG